jgi:NAD(P)-dependent dehydrogenase (short-subunit alcohol dehydrogenase family)
VTLTVLNTATEEPIAELEKPGIEETDAAVARAVDSARPREIPDAALFLASDESSFCTAQPFIVDGGLSAGIPASD